MLDQVNILKLKKELDSLSQQFPIAYEIHGLTKCLVYYLPINLPVDKANWIQRKRNSAIRFEMDTLDLFQKNKGDERSFALKYGLSLKDYTLTPGAVCIRNTEGILEGIITITGLSPQEDHDIAIQALNVLK